jgi:hypothetical protein
MKNRPNAYLELVLLHQALANQETANGIALVTLQLNNLAVLGMLHNSAVACKLLLEVLYQLQGE